MHGLKLPGQGTHLNTASRAVPGSVCMRHHDPSVKKNGSQSAADRNMISNLTSLSLQNRLEFRISTERSSRVQDSQKTRLPSLSTGPYSSSEFDDPFLPTEVVGTWVVLIQLLHCSSRTLSRSDLGWKPVEALCGSSLLFSYLCIAPPPAPHAQCMGISLYDPWNTAEVTVCRF